MRMNRAEVLSAEEIQLIHEASLRILDEQGVVVFSDAMRAFFATKGLPVDENTAVVKIPPSAVEYALSQVPRSFSLYTVDGKTWKTVGDGEPLFACGHNAIFVLDPKTGQRRNSQVKDVENFVAIADQLADIDVVGIPLMPQDTIPESSLLHAVRATLKKTKKPIYYSSESAGINRAIIRIAQTIDPLVSNRPFLVSQLSPTSPLYWEKGAIEALYEVCRVGIPLAILPEPIAGASAPYTLAGLLTMHNAECLSGIVFAQLVREGTPVVYASSWTAYDMKANMAVIGTPETNILRIAGAQMAAFYRLPAHTTAPNADAHFHDEQNAWERTLSAFVAAQAGNHLIVNAGMFATGLTVSLEQLVMDAEIIGITRRMLKGMEVSREKIFLDEIQRVGQRGNYLTEESTLRNLRSGEFWRSEVSILDNYERCIARELTDVVLEAREKANAFLNRSSFDHLSPDLLAEVDRIISFYEKEGEEAPFDIV